MGRRIGFALTAALLAVAALFSPASAGETDQSDNVKLLQRIRYKGGSEIAFHGDFLYAGQWDGHFNRRELPNQGGLHVIDVSGARAKPVGFLHCPGNDNDVDVVSPDVVILGFHRNGCLPEGPDGASGMITVDVSDPAKPRMLGGVHVPTGVHTLTPYPGRPLVYTSPGGGTGPMYPSSIVDVSNPKKPKVVGEFTPRIGGCHDFTFHFTRQHKLGFCAGGGGDWVDAEISIWDVSDPLAPALLTQILNPALEYPHYALASPDGKILAVQDENYMAHECITGMTPLGSIWFYDISDPTNPQLRGHFDPPRGDDGVGTLIGWVPSWCTSHHYNFVPGTRNLVTAWYTGGTNVIDVSDPSAPKEIAHYTPDDAAVWTSQYFDGRVYVSDFTRGLDILKIRGIEPKS